LGPANSSQEDQLAQELESAVAVVVGQLRSGPQPRGHGGLHTADALQSIAVARAAAEAIEQATTALAGQARAAGCTWAEIGAALSISRQAAHQRFGERQRDEADGTATALARRARQIFAQVNEGEWDSVSADWHQVMHDANALERVREAWSSVTATAGPLQKVWNCRPARSDGPYRTVDVPLSFKHGPMKGRVVFTEDAKVAGLFVLLPDAP